MKIPRSYRRVFSFYPRRNPEMRILIIGGAGEVGRYLTKDLSRRGHEITVLDRGPKPSGMGEDLTAYLQEISLMPR